VLSIPAARRYRWRLAGGRLIMIGTNLRFSPNRLEQLRPDAAWECTAQSVTRVRTQGRVWLVVETSESIELFRIFGAQAAASKIEEAIHAAVTTSTGP
jgi:hypothetical protein